MTGTQAYVRHGLRSIDGWLTPLDAALLAAVAAEQADAGISGSVGEIGVHHGRTFILLALALRPDERGFAIDIFGDQALNQDRSGRGDEAVFRANLARFGIAAERVAILRTPSANLTWPDIAARVGSKARLFSVDGGHTAAIVQHDLSVAAAGLADGGVIIADDYFNAEFPGVSEGAARFLLGCAGAIIPFAQGDSRMFLCHPALAPRYGAATRRAGGRHFVRTGQMWGGEVALFRTPRTLMHRVRASAIARGLTDHPIGVRMKPLIRRFLAD